MAITLRASFSGLNEIRRDLESVELGLGRELNEALRSAVSPLARATQRYTPVGPGPRFENDDDRLPHVRDTITARAAGNAIVVDSTHPAAGVLNFGGTIAPKGHPIDFRAHAMGEKAGRQELPRIERDIQNAIDALTAQHGLSQ